MKTFQHFMLLTLALVLFMGTNLNAQSETNNNTFLIIQKNNGEEKSSQKF